MTVNRDCLNEAALVDYLYDECPPRDRAVMSAHLALCARCSHELEGLRYTRVGLAEWTPPPTELGFRIVAGTEQSVLQPVAAAPRWWTQPLPAWAQAAAAAVIFATGLGLGAMRGTTSGEPATAASRQELASVEQRLRAEMQQLGPRPAATPVAATAAPETTRVATVPTAPTLQQVQALIAESEQRTGRELALRTAEVIRDFDTQRRGDLARIEQTFGQIEGRTGAAEAQQQQLLNMIRRVSQ